MGKENNVKKYYSLERNGKQADLYIFGDITSNTYREKQKDAYTIVKELRELDAEEVNVHINSYGGDVSEGLAIYNTLKSSKMKVRTLCDGFACSAASVIFMAGEERIMNSASLLMIHNAWTYTAGNASELRKEADDLEKITQASVNAYVSRTNISEEEVKKLMDEESWISAKEAVRDGFATQILEEEESGAKQSAFMTIRKKLLKETDPGEGTGNAAQMDVDEIANKVVEKLKPLMKEKEAGERNPESGNGWEDFFKEKGE